MIQSVVTYEEKLMSWMMIHCSAHRLPHAERNQSLIIDVEVTAGPYQRSKESLAHRRPQVEGEMSKHESIERGWYVGCRSLRDEISPSILEKKSQCCVTVLEQIQHLILGDSRHAACISPHRIPAQHHRDVVIRREGQTAAVARHRVRGI